VTGTQDWRLGLPPTCAGADKAHPDKFMELIGRDGPRDEHDPVVLIWRCPRCLHIWRERE
jgi:hypothetical protein